MLLDRFSVADIRRWAAYRDKILRFHWDYYTNLAFQRSKIADRLRVALLEAEEGPFPFPKWQRAIKYRYGLEPFSVEGSLVDPGGRFNVSMSGSIEKVIDLRHSERLDGFVALIKDFQIPAYLVKAAREIRLPPPELVRTVQRLLDTLHDPNWRSWPMQFDVPVASQIFGQLVAEAGIEGIVYPSKFNGKECLAVFPKNFENSESFIDLDDPPPPETKVRRLDAQTWAFLLSVGNSQLGAVIE